MRSHKIRVSGDEKVNIFENRKDDDFESYDFLWILWILFWANGLPVNNLCFELGLGSNRDFKCFHRKVSMV